jgi:hypothetical protein
MEFENKAYLLDLSIILSTNDIKDDLIDMNLYLNFYNFKLILKRGDIIKTKKKYYIYDGEKIINLLYSNENEYGEIPKIFDINNFKSLNYWSDVLPYTYLVPFHFKDTYISNINIKKDKSYCYFTHSDCVYNIIIISLNDILNLKIIKKILKKNKNIFHCLQYFHFEEFYLNYKELISDFKYNKKNDLFLVIEDHM